MARIIFLGTSGDLSVYSRVYRLSGGFILEFDNDQFHIDPGPNTLYSASKSQINLRKNTALIVTNKKANFSNDANVVIDAMTYGGLDKKGVLITNEEISNTLNTEFVEKLIKVDIGKKVGVQNIEIQTMPADGFGVKFITADFVLAYTSLVKYSKKITKEYTNVNILILCLQHPFEEFKTEFLNGDDAVKFVNDVQPQLVLLTGFGYKALKYDPLILAREIQRRTGVQTIAANDGLVISPGTYGAKSKQKTLMDMNKFGRRHNSVDIKDENQIKLKE